MSLMDELPDEVAEAIRADGRDAGDFLLDLVRSRPASPSGPEAPPGANRDVRPLRPRYYPGDDVEVMEELDYQPPPKKVVGTMTVTFGPLRPHLPPQVPDEE